MYSLFPTPVRFQILPGSVDIREVAFTQISPVLQEECSAFGFDFSVALHKLFPVSTGSIPLSIHKENGCAGSFKISITPTSISLFCADGAALYYTIGALRQLVFQSQPLLPCANIEDAPALSVRGIMLDIGRDKVPTMDTLFALLDRFADMRINHVQLYMEGFCFDYSHYRYLFSDETPLTAAEFRLLTTYAKARFIDLVPNQNVLGHMDQWLAKPQFRHLAECEDGYMFNNLFWRPPMTLDVRDAGSLVFAKELLDILLENSGSPYVNLNLDEPFELGMGKNAEIAKKNGRLSLYFDYAEQLNQYCRGHGKKMMMWGDEVLQSPENAAKLPADVTLLDWIYEGDANFEEHAKLLQQSKLRYCLCPGTSSWCSFTGRTDNMKKNIANAAACAVRYGGAGIITTDWGDLGHWQYISASYPAFAYAAFYSWCGDRAADSAVKWYCNTFIYQSSDGSAFDVVQELGNYYKLEHTPLYNTTLCFAVMSSKYAFDSIAEFDEKMERLLILSANIAKTNGIAPQPARIGMQDGEMQAYLKLLSNKIDAATLNCPESELIRSEMHSGLSMVRHGALLYKTMTADRHSPDFSDRLTALSNDLDDIMKTHYSLWCARNRTGGFARSTAQMNQLIDFYSRHKL